ERSAENRLEFGADLPQRAVAAAVLDDGPRLQPEDRHLGEDVLEHQPRRGDEDARAPELRPERKSPLTEAELRIERPHLNEADRVLESDRHDAEADVASVGLLLVRPEDEPLE